MRAISFLHSYVLTSFSLRFEFTNYVLRRAFCEQLDVLTNAIRKAKTLYVVRKIVRKTVVWTILKKKENEMDDSM